MWYFVGAWGLMNDMYHGCRKFDQGPLLKLRRRFMPEMEISHTWPWLSFLRRSRTPPGFEGSKVRRLWTLALERGLNVLDVSKCTLCTREKVCKLRTNSKWMNKIEHADLIKFGEFREWQLHSKLRCIMLSSNPILLVENSPKMMVPKTRKSSVTHNFLYSNSR